MRVLMLETDRHSADGVAVRLENAGHTVVRCHDDDTPAFPCNGLANAGGCPLDDAQGVDVVIDHRAHAYPRPTDYEDGVSCALRRHIPLVASGVTVLSPFEPWTTTSTEGVDIVAACEAAAAAPLERIAAPAQAVAREVFALAGRDPEGVTVDVHRQGRRLQVLATIPADATDVEGPVAVKVAGAVRAVDRDASQIDVAVQRAEA